MTALLAIYFLLLVLYSFFTYGLTAPNLLLLNQDWFIKWQFWMWEQIFNQRDLAVKLYVNLIIALFFIYLIILKKYSKQIFDFAHAKQIKKTLIIFLLIISPLVLSFNALSYDVFNYIFNAKMVLVYQANPHQKTALDFSNDLWTRFMHNTHTPAPYGYGWTIFSLIPYALSQNKFLISWFVFRLLSVGSIILLFFTLLGFKKKFNWHLAALFLNPLFLIEIISNSHNDLWMMVPALASLLIIQQLKKFNCLKIFLSMGLLAFSISTKLATVILAPIWLFLLIKQLKLKPKLPKILDQLWLLIEKKWTLISSILLILPLFTMRSQQFLPWYLIWSLVWLPLIKTKWWINTLLIFSFTSLMRYAPWIKFNEFSPAIINQQKLITWLLPLGYLLFIAIWTIGKTFLTKNKLQ